MRTFNAEKLVHYSQCEPRHEHDCSCCVFVGHYEDSDLYYCLTEPTVIARYGELGDYGSNIAFVGGSDPAITAAYVAAWSFIPVTHKEDRKILSDAFKKSDYYSPELDRELRIAALKLTKKEMELLELELSGLKHEAARLRSQQQLEHANLGVPSYDPELGYIDYQESDYE